MIITCKGCTERHMGCHSTCTRYIEAKTEHDKQREEIRHTKEVNNDITSFVIDSAKKNAERARRRSRK